MEEGVAGFLLKDAPASEPAAAIRRPAAGERIVDPGLAAAAQGQGVSPLTPREHEVLAASWEHRDDRRAGQSPPPLCGGDGPLPPVLGDAEPRRPQRR